MIFTMLINVECSQHCVVRVVVVSGALGERIQGVVEWPTHLTGFMLQFCQILDC